MLGIGFHGIPGLALHGALPVTVTVRVTSAKAAEMIERVVKRVDGRMIAAVWVVDVSGVSGLID